LGLLININNFCFEGYVVFRLFYTFRGGLVVGWSDGWLGGRGAGKAEIIANSAQLGLELGLSLAIISRNFSWNRPNKSEKFCLKQFTHNCRICDKTFKKFSSFRLILVSIRSNHIFELNWIIGLTLLLRSHSIMDKHTRMGKNQKHV